MATFKADRRLYETADRDALVEEGDPRGRWLLAGLTRTIGEADVKKYGLTMQDGRIVYEGCPTEFGELAPQVKEARAHEDKMLQAHADKSAEAKAERKAAAEAEGAEPDPVIRLGSAPGDGSEDSDRNTEELGEWTLKSTPEEYLERYPTGKNAELAQRHIDAATDGASGDS